MSSGHLGGNCKLLKRSRRWPEITLQKKNRGELIRAALMKLSADDRDILNLVYFHENSVEDCALILNLPVATVKTRMLSARRKLAELVPEA